MPQQREQLQYAVTIALVRMVIIEPNLLVRHLFSSVRSAYKNSDLTDDEHGQSDQDEPLPWTQSVDWTRYPRDSEPRPGAHFTPFGYVAFCEPFCFVFSFTFYTFHRCLTSRCSQPPLAASVSFGYVSPAVADLYVSPLPCGSGHYEFSKICRKDWPVGYYVSDPESGTNECNRTHSR